MKLKSQIKFEIPKIGETCIKHVMKTVFVVGAHVNDGGPSGRFALTEAAFYGNRKAIDVLLAYHADIEVQSSSMLNATPVTAAVMGHQIKIVEFLISVSTQWGYHMTKTLQNGGVQPISEIFHIENLIVCFIETYLISI